MTSRKTGLMSGTTSREESRARQRRGGLTTLARLGGEQMTAPMRAGFRARFEREALELATKRGERLSAKQLDERVTALMRAHMAKMTEARMVKQAERRSRGEPVRGGGRSGGIDRLMADAQRRAVAEPITTAAIQRIVEPVKLCVGCWLEMCVDEPFPSEATSTLCARHLAAYTERPVLYRASSTVIPYTGNRAVSLQSRRNTKSAPVPLERSRNLNQAAVTPALLHWNSCKPMASISVEHSMHVHA